MGATPSHRVASRDEVPEHTLRLLHPLPDQQLLTDYGWFQPQRPTDQVLVILARTIESWPYS